MVHDEMLVEVDHDQAQGVQDALVHEMLAAGQDLFPQVPMAVDARFGERWEH
jgi:DNA polymerase I-like protein with 3'-5' exonuclease and polymerase domains